MTVPQQGPGAPAAGPAAGRTWGQRLVIASGAVIAVIALGGALLVGVAWWRLSSFERVDLDTSPNEVGEPANFLIVGSDSRESISPDDPDAGAFLGEEVSGQRTDTIIVARVDPGANRVSLLSIPRDLWVPLGNGTVEDRINTAFAEGGAQELIDTVENNLAIEINHYVEVDFGGFKDLVDTVGGVPMYFDTALYDEYSGLDIAAPGCVTLNGSQALAFARSRQLQYLDPVTGEWSQDFTADLGRITRQQLFLRRAMDRASSLGLTDVTKLNRLVSVATDNVKFDDALGSSDLLRLARRFAASDSDAMTSYALPTDLAETDAGASILLLRAEEAQPILDIFRGLAPASPPTSAPLLPAQVAVTVLNGTGIDGQAGEAADALGTIGFAMGNVGDASSLAETRTSLRFAAGSRSAAELIAPYLQAGIVMVEDPAAGNGVVLVTGADFRGVTVPETVTDDTTTEATEAPAITTTSVGVAPPDEQPGQACG